MNLDLIEISLEENLLAEVLAAHLMVVQELQRNLGFFCASDHVLAVGYLQPDGPQNAW